MLFKLNYQLDKPTLNNRIYPQKIFNDAINKAFSIYNHRIPIIKKEAVVSLNFKQEDIIGYVRSYSLKDKTIVILHCEFISMFKTEYQYINNNNLFLTTNITASFNDKEISEMTILNFLITDEAVEEVINTNINDLNKEINVDE